MDELSGMCDVEATGQLGRSCTARPVPSQWSHSNGVALQNIFIVIIRCLVLLHSYPGYKMGLKGVETLQIGNQDCTNMRYRIICLSLVDPIQP